MSHSGSPTKLKVISQGHKEEKDAHDGWYRWYMVSAWHLSGVPSHANVRGER